MFLLVVFTQFVGSLILIIYPFRFDGVAHSSVISGTIGGKVNSTAALRMARARCVHIRLF